jgi:predicted alpha/beta-hydrolase family hydrolase
VNLARRLAAVGIDVTTFDFPYMEEKRRAPDRADVLERCFRRVLEHVDGIGTSPIVIGGKSMGGRIATHVSAQGADIAGVFALGYPLHPPGRPDQPRTAHLPAITVPVLIVQGERDPFGTPSELKAVIGTIPARVELEVVAGGDHSLAVRGRPAGQLSDWLGDRIARWMRSI